MVETAIAFLVALAGSLVPIISIEIYLLGASALHPDGQLVAMVVAAAVAQTVGKLVYYYLGSGVLHLPWLKRQADRATRSGARSRRLEGWQDQAHRRPVWAAGIMFSSSFVSVPPYMVMCVLAGTTRMRVSHFLLASLVGRLARFTLVVFVPAAGATWLT
ncbi:VTT domain-containing protein [Lipingzhangella sp. LS1_29]|uniref:VTT domain-containing protein n=1 Tax=Lipingzhangella rawalii TaxID=2055835 RepID=A0ABU2H6Y4_9ACTN|nr:VTT domain-containing protein [Lipingzhangella rawalii]MDS1270609.1 VTT domain-containing protein [Lipingzhangella rawalii]